MTPGRLIDGKYQVTRLLGEGGMGAVYEARHTGTGRRVAVKVILGEDPTKNRTVIERFQREARAAGAIESRHIAHVLDTGIDAATQHPYLVMEFLLGEDLQQAIKRLGPIDPTIALRIVAQACVGLQKAHETGVVHRDLKPANVFLTSQDGGEILVKLLDFGIAKVNVDRMNGAAGAGLTRTGAFLGSPLYMSPEHCKSPKTVDHRTDIWSLGVVLYEALSAQTPYGHCETMSSLFIAIDSEQPRSVRDFAPWVPAEVVAIVERAVAKDVTRRFQSAAEMTAAIRPLLGQGTYLHESMLTPFPAPRTMAMPLPAPPATLPASPSQAALPVHGGTASSLASSVAPTPKVSSPGATALIAVSAALALGAAGLGVYRLTPHTLGKAAEAAAAGSETTPSTPPSGAAPPTAPTAVPSSLAESPPPKPTVSASSIAAPPAASSPPSSASTAPARVAPSVAKPPRGASEPAATGPRAAAAPPAGAPAAKNCHPDYDLDAEGNKVFKPECFRQ